MSVESENLMLEGIMDVAQDFVDMLGEEGDDAAAQPDAVAENHGMSDAVAENYEIARKIADWNPSKTRVKLPEVPCQTLFNRAETKRKVLASGQMADVFDADNFRYTQLYAEFATAAYHGGDASCDATVVDELEVIKLPLNDPIPATILEKNGNAKGTGCFGQKSKKETKCEFALLKDELFHSEVLMSNMILHKPTDTEVWFCCYKRNPDYEQHFKEKDLVKHISNDEPLRMVIAARGTESLDDVASDLKFNLVNLPNPERYAPFEHLAELPMDKVKVHEGFAEQVVGISNEIDSEILQTITKYHNDHSDLTVEQLLDKHPMMFTFVGHSMGGALARMFCFDYLCRNAAKGQGWTRLVTIGSAPTGNVEFASTLDKLLGTEDDPIRCLHVVNNRDPVPVSLDGWWAKFASGKYEHCGTLVWLNEEGEVKVGKPTLKLCQCPCTIYKAGKEHQISGYMSALKKTRQYAAECAFQGTGRYAS